MSEDNVVTFPGAIRCDAQLGVIGADKCLSPVAFECHCARCWRESDPGERFHACEAHRDEAAESHRRIRGREPEWYPFRVKHSEPQPTASTARPQAHDPGCDCPGCKNDIGCFRSQE